MCVCKGNALKGSAVNTASLVHKVRFVASTLLDALAAPNAPDQAGLNPDQARAMAKTQRAQTYLCEFYC